MLNNNQQKNNDEDLVLSNFRKFAGTFFQNYPIPQLALLNTIVEKCNQTQLLSNLDNTIVVGVQHILETTVSLFDSLIRLGIRPHNMYFSGKSYSSSSIIEDVIYKRGINLIGNLPQKQIGEFKETFIAQIKNLWSKVEDDLERKKIDKIIILDDGGYCLKLLPDKLKFNYKIVGVEQTRGGLYSENIKILPCPLIDVATSASKKIIISPFIAEAILKKVKEYFKQFEHMNKKIVCGVIGNGAIGNAITSYLLSKGFQVLVYDQNEKSFAQSRPNPNLFRAPNIEYIIGNSQVIFGCTGRDVTENIDALSFINNDKYFISCSSQDIEFLSLLKQIAKHIEVEDPLSDIVYNKDKTTKIAMVQGGFPLNFDRTPESVPASEIALARGLMLGGFIQALFISHNLIPDGITKNEPGEIYQIDPYVQRFIVANWCSIMVNLYKDDINRHPTIVNFYKNDMDKCFSNIEWLIRNSGGTCYSMNLLRNIFREVDINEDPSILLNQEQTENNSNRRAKL